MTQGLFKTEQECLAALEREYEPTFRKYEQFAQQDQLHAKVERDRTRLRWQYTPRMANKPNMYEAWCEEKTP